MSKKKETIQKIRQMNGKQLAEFFAQAVKIAAKRRKSA